MFLCFKLKAWTIEDQELLGLAVAARALIAHFEGSDALKGGIDLKATVKAPVQAKVLELKVGSWFLLVQAREFNGSWRSF